MVPIRIKQFPNFLLDIVKKNKILKSPLQSQRRFYLCYFCCASYFKYLYCSLHSLANHIKDTPYSVVIFNDEEQPLSERQIAVLQELIPGTEVISWPKSMGWGSNQISNIWRAYGMASANANDEDIIARVDADVFFFNDRIFRLVERSNADLIGDGHYVGFKYTQGGCYFFKASAINKINKMLSKESIDQVLSEIEIIVEDIAAFHFAKRLNLKILMTWFMMFPDEMRNAGKLNSWLKWKFSCAHFVMKNKVIMLDFYTKHLLRGKELTDFLRIIETI